jgi:hypothetical protein
MSRSNYSDDGEYLELWRNAVALAIAGKRGQKFFRDLLAALDAMSEKLLIADDLIDEDGSVCAIGSLGKTRGIDMSKLDPEDPHTVASAFGIANCLAQEVVYMNDEWGKYDETPEQRYWRMRKWVQEQIKMEAPRPVPAPQS